MHGSFENGNPWIDIIVRGVTGQEKVVRALVDTGFNDYLTLPYVVAFPLGLVLKGAQVSKLADGSTSHHFVCIGEVEVDNKSVAVPIIIQPTCTILLGTQLLKKINKKLQIDFLQETVELTD